MVYLYFGTGVSNLLYYYKSLFSLHMIFHIAVLILELGVDSLEIPSIMEENRAELLYCLL